MSESGSMSVRVVRTQQEQMHVRDAFEPCVMNVMASENFSVHRQ